ncbi:hypothetical protein TKWG_11175 [Advenella kashmirensis WT001]|uniref:Uncharacterized protein n=1 Tax=Advenella kashmirensis (strain DSM 17095 / LMG 22695 / WT001) TaxID=1036672 RepID=I3UBR4_ADVKW|nr:hypothetical protein [Advenella kashmirensis]AFK62452.1 hypothetical protein TKWG_11175 [Advenella kashmirensis WT001]
MSIDSVLIIAGIAAFLIFHYFFRPKHNTEEQIWKLISRERICRDTQVDQKDLRINVTSYYEVDESKSRLPAQSQYNFKVSCKMAGPGGKRRKWVTVGDGYSVNITSDAGLIEESIIQDIKHTQDALMRPGK